MRTLPASWSRGLVRGEGGRPSGLWPGCSPGLWVPLTRHWDAPEEAERWGLLDTAPVDGRGRKGRDERERIRQREKQKDRERQRKTERGREREKWTERG